MFFASPRCVTAIDWEDEDEKIPINIKRFVGSAAHAVVSLCRGQ